MKQVVLVLLALTSSATFAQGAELKQRIPEKTWQASGLDKLSAQELDALAEWIDSKHAGTVNAPSVPVATVKIDNSPPIDTPKPPAARETFSAELAAPIDSLGGKGTRYALSNGQVWQQTCDTRWGNKPNSTVVQFKPAIMGRWRMRVLSNNTFITVKRIQ
jgi:hypothetical protein